MVLDEKVRKQVTKQFDRLTGSVRLVVFTQEFECDYCRETRSIAEELAELSDKVSVRVYDFVRDSDAVKKYRIERIPATVVEWAEDYGIRFNGIPGGYEFTSLLETIRLVSQRKSELEPSTVEFLNGLKEDVDIKVFVTPTCPYCPRAVVLANHMAIAAPRVTARMIEVSEFPELAVKYQVQGVPRTVVNETIVQEGAAPEGVMVSLLKGKLK